MAPWLRLDGLALHLDTYDRALIWTTVALSLALNVAVPWVEELYFRGYLLHRMGRFGRWAPLANAALFSLYHVWLPWEFLSRLVALLPAIYFTWWKRNLGVAIWVHMLLNSTGSLGLLVLVLTPYVLDLGSFRHTPPEEGWLHGDCALPMACAPRASTQWRPGLPARSRTHGS